MQPPAIRTQERQVILWRSAFLLSASIVLAGSVIDTGSSVVSGLDDKLQHLLAFAGLAVMGCMGFPHLPVRTVLLPALLGYGLLIESIQCFLPWREFSLLDLAADAAGAVPGALAVGAWRRRTPPGGEAAP